VSLEDGHGIARDDHSTNNISGSAVADAWEAADKASVVTPPWEQALHLLASIGVRYTTAALGLKDARTVRNPPISWLNWTPIRWCVKPSTSLGFAMVLSQFISAQHLFGWVGTSTVPLRRPSLAHCMSCIRK
jgi:hypothetical protein